jgi:hydroxypyruvate reductase
LKNLMNLNTEKLRRDAMTIFRAGLQAVDANAAVQRFVQRDRAALKVAEKNYDLKSYERILVVGAGKASAAMAQALEQILDDHISEGLINVKYGHLAPLQKIKLNEAGHPLPDEAGLNGARHIVQLLESAGGRDLIFCLLSGGGSALLPLPAEGISLNEKQEVTKKLLACGATIHEMNAVRKHLSQIKGGQLARFAYPAAVVALILSDVVGDQLDVIASGPTVPDASTFQEAQNILQRYGLWESLPKSVIMRIQKGVASEIPETPKSGDAIFSNVQNVVIGSNILALLAAEETAKKLGYQTLILSSAIEGETREAARLHAAIAKEIVRSGRPVTRPACVISGGETTVTLRGAGKGGRNQEFVLAAAMEIAGLENTVIFSAGTDGSDGPTDAAGAICDGQTAARAQAAGLSDTDPPRGNALEHLNQNNAYPFFKKLGDLVITGPTNTNVMDLRLILVG